MAVCKVKTGLTIVEQLIHCMRSLPREFPAQIHTTKLLVKRNAGFALLAELEIMDKQVSPTPLTVCV